MEITISEFSIRLISTKYFDIPGVKSFYAKSLSNNSICGIYEIDTRDNTIGMNNTSSRDFDKWIVEKFNEYKSSNFKFGNDMYEPTEQIVINNFFRYLVSCNRDYVINSI